MGIRFTCPSGHKLHVKTFLAGKRGVCPKCGAKILIPSAEDSQPSINGSATDVREAKRAEATLEKGGAAEALGSPSIIIALADMPVLAQTPVETAPRTEKGEPPVDQPAPTQTAIDPQAAASPAKRYVAYRERARRNQLNIAIALLVAVIVLALVLIFVLQGRADPASAWHIGPAQLEMGQRSPYLHVTTGDKIFSGRPNNQVLVL